MGSPSTMRIMDVNEGDVTLKWDPSNADEVAHARATFDKFTVEKKFSAFRVDAAGKQSQRLTAFDPSATQMILAAPVVGG